MEKKKSSISEFLKKVHSLITPKNCDYFKSEINILIY